MSRFNAGVKPRKVDNLAGGRAFAMNAKRELLHAVLTTFLDDKFYESGQERIERIKSLIVQTPPEFVARLAVVARKEFHLRSVFHILIGELSKNHRGDSLVMKAVEKGVERPDDLTEITAYLNGRLSKQLKRGFRHAILKFSPYSLAKYRSGKKKVKMVDIFNLVHPKAQFATPEQKEAWEALMENRLINTDTWEARLSSGEDKAKVWRDLIMEEKIGYMALLRNLRNIDAQADTETRTKAASLIKDRRRILQSKQLPFRYWKAYQNVDGRLFTTAIARAMDIAVGNVPAMEGTTLLAVDVSGSMSGDPIEKASILAAALFKKADCDIILYDTDAKLLKLNSVDSVISNAEKIQHAAMGGATNTGLVFEAAVALKKKYDRIIIVSDNESWRSDAQMAYKKYRQVNDCYVYAIDIQGYGTTDIAGEKVSHLCGFSERIFDFMLAKERGIDTMEEYIANYDL